MTRLLTAAVLFAAAAGVTAADDAEKALKELEGSYTVKALSKGGNPAPDEAIKGIEAFIIKGDAITVKTADGGEKKAKFKLDPKQKPAHIDLTPTDGPKKDEVMKGVYKFEKG